MKKMPEKAVTALYTIDKKIKELYDRRDTIVKKVFAKLGECQGVVKVDGPKPFLRVKITDSLDAFSKGDTLYRSAGISRYNADISLLKNEPKS